MSSKIDDPLDASFEAWPEEPEGWDKKSRELALRFSGLYLASAAVLKILKDQFLPESRIGRIKYSFDGMVLKLKAMESEYADEREKLKQVQARIEGPQFQQAVAAACEEAARATDEKKIQRFAAVLAGSLIPNEWANSGDDLAAMIRDVGQLGEQDILALDILETAFRPTYGANPNLTGTNQFVEHLNDLTQAVHVHKIHLDDFYGTCLRLSGFGLATEDRPAVRPNGERCFRLTRRGLALLDYLKLGAERKQSQSPG
jgi:hypothetical protein